MYATYCSAGADQNAAVFVRGIPEQLYAADGNLARCYHHFWVLRLAMEERANEEPGVADKHAEAGEDEKFCQLPPGDVAFVRGVDRKLIFPKRLVTRRVATSSSSASHM